MSVIKLFGGTLHLDGSHVQWETRQKVYRFVVGCSYDRNYKSRGKYTVTAVSTEGVVTLQSVVDSRVSHSQVQSFVGSYGVAQQKKDVRKLREEERELRKKERERKREAAELARVLPTDSMNHSVREQDRGISVLIHSLMQDMEGRLAASIRAHIGNMELRLKEELGVQHLEHKRELVDAAEKTRDAILAQGKETEERLAAAIVKGLS